MRFTFTRVLCGVLLLVLATVFTLNYSTENTLSEKERYIEFIENHPYANRQISLEELEGMPKQDRPDLAAEHNFLQVVDPKLKRIPTERLAAAYEDMKVKYRLNGKKKNLLFQSFSNDSDAESAEQLNRAAIPNVNWRERGPNNVGGRTRALMWDPNDPNTTKVWAGSVSGGIWFNNDITDQGSSWVPVDDFLASLAISSFAYDPNNTQTFYAGTGEGFVAGNLSGGVSGAGLYKSTNGGDTWTLLPSTEGPDFRFVQKVVVTAPGTVIITTRPSLNEGGSGGVFRSTDGGDTWTNVIGGRGADLQVASNGDVYASTGVGTGIGDLWRSTDDGISWTEITPPGGSPRWIEIAVAPSQSDETSSTRIYAVAQNAAATTTVLWLQRSDDGGDTWTELTIPRNRTPGCGSAAEDFTRGQAFYDMILAVQPDNADVVTLGGIEIFRSIDAGVNFNGISISNSNCDSFVHADQHEAVFRPGFPNEAVFGHDGGVSYSANVGDPGADPDFVTRNNNYSVTQFFAVATSNVANSGYFLAGAQDNSTSRITAESGLSAQVIIGGDGAFCHVDQTDDQFQIAAVQFNGVFHSSNGGANFQGLLGQDQSTGFINPTDLDNQSHILYMRGANNELRRIDNINTATPSAQVITSVNIGTISHINANSPTDNRLYVGTLQGDVFRLDNANTANPVITNITNNINSPGRVSSVDFDASEDRLIATYSNFGVTSVWVSEDAGQNWISKDDAGFGLPDIPVRWSMFNPNNSNQVLLATELGVWSSDDVFADNPGWEPTSTNLANVRCDMLQYREVDGIVVVATFGRGVFTTDAFSSEQDTSGPTIASLEPSDDEEEVLLDASLSVNFNEVIQRGSGNITILRSTDDSVFETIDINSTNVSTSGATLIVDRSLALDPSTAFYVNIDPDAITDSNGNNFAGISDNTTWNFTTFNGDLPPTVANPVQNFRIERDANETTTFTVDLNDVFEDPDSEIEIQLTVDSNPGVVQTTLEGNVLTVTNVLGETGEAVFTATATSNGLEASDTFVVTVGDNILVNQFDQLSGGGFVSNFRTDTNLTIQFAEDFEVEEGEIWDITGVSVLGFNSEEPINSFRVELYGDDGAGNVDDGNLIFEADVDVDYLFTGNALQPIRIPVEIEQLVPGNYWMSVVSIAPTGTDTNWAWATRNPSTNRGFQVNDREGQIFGLTANTWIAGENTNFSDTDMTLILDGEAFLPPNSPSDLTAEITEESNISLSWIDNADDELGFVIERSTSLDGTYEQIGNVGPDITAFIDSDDLDSNTEYFYRVFATGDIGNSAFSNVAELLTLPSAPINLAAGAIEGGNFTLIWESEDGVDDFEVDISADNFATFVGEFEAFAVEGASNLAVQDLEIGTYQVRVRATNSSGASGNSEALEVVLATVTSTRSNVETFDFNVFPNPAVNELTIRIPDQVNEDLNLRVIGLNGNTVVNRRVSALEREITLQTDGLRNGVYIISLRNDDNFSRARFTKVD